MGVSCKQKLTYILIFYTLKCMLTLNSHKYVSFKCLYRWTILCLVLNRSSQHELQTKSGCPSDVTNSRAFICRIGPYMGTLKLLGCVNHSTRASSISVCAAVCSLCHSGKRHDNSKASSVFLFFMMVETVLLATLNS